MNFVLEKLPTAVRIDGAVYEINTDFRNCLKILRAFDADELTETEKLTVLIRRLYKTIPNNTASAILQGLKFLNLGKEMNSAQRTQLKVYDLDKDSNYIYTAFKSSFNIDLNSVEHLHWWEFRSLFADLGKDCFFNTLVSLRNRQATGKLTKEEKEFVNKNRELISLTEQKHSAAVDNFIKNIGKER